MVSGSGARAVARCDALGVMPYSALEGALYRGFLTPAHAAALERLAVWMTDAGMTVRLDAAANLIGRYEGARAGAPALLIGSHIDSVRDAGHFDGPLGVMLGVEAVTALRESGRRPSFAIEVVAFGDEEGSRFPASMLCSRALAGVLALDALDVVDSDGISVREAMDAFEVGGMRAEHGGDFVSAARSPEEVVAYLEPHIEQGPVLEDEGLSVGVVSGIAAQLRYEIRITGVAGHAGTNAMHLRRDALAGAAEILLVVERVAKLGPDDLVATVGKLSAAPGAVNVVPGEVVFSLDVRAGDQAVRDAAAVRILTDAEAIASARGLGIEVRHVQDLTASPCDPELVALLENAMEAAGYASRTLVSGAGHDAMVMSGLCSTAMLFIRCDKGVSHNPAERAKPEDADAALAVILEFISRLEARHGAV